MTRFKILTSVVMSLCAVFMQAQEQAATIIGTISDYKGQDTLYCYYDPDIAVDTIKINADGTFKAVYPINEETSGILFWRGLHGNAAASFIMQKDEELEIFINH